MFATWILLLSLPFIAPQGAVQSRCADCHFAHPEAPGRDHILEWDRSAHGRHDVGCDGCHGGNPATFEELAAHMNLLSPSNPASPVARRQLPATCGKCHIGPYVSFQESSHFQLLKEGDRRTPTCSTCHGDVGAHLLSPQRLEQACLSCHKKEHAELGDEPALARRLFEDVGRVRENFKTVQVLIRRLDSESQSAFREELRQAEVPLIEAVEMAHSFEFKEASARLEVTNLRLQEILKKLVR